MFVGSLTLGGGSRSVGATIEASVIVNERNGLVTTVKKLNASKSCVFHRHRGRLHTGTAYMDKVKSIVETFLRDDEGLFEDQPKDLDALRVTIRITGAFHDFLNKWGNAPPKDEVEYMVGTIRSGIDFFFSMMFLYRILDTSRARRTFSWEVTPEFARMRQSFLSMFDTLASEGLEFTERLACLLILTKIQLVFLASNFLADGQLA